MSNPIGETTTTGMKRFPGGSAALEDSASVEPASASLERGGFAASLDRDIEDVLLKKAKKGDTSAYGRLMMAYQDRLYSLAFRLLANHEDAEEAVQDAFIKAWRNLGQFHGKSSFYTWIYRIAVNSALNRLSHEKRRGRGKFLDLDEVLRPDGETLGRDLPDPGLTPSEQANQAKLEAAIQKEVAQLPGDLRVVVVLRDIEGMAYETVSETLGLPLGTVKSRLHKARMKLQEALRVYLV